MTKQHHKTTMLFLCAIFTALVAIGAFIRIPTPLVPFTLQFWCTTMAGLLLGPGYGAMSVLVYVLLGLVGVPVFTQGGGPGYIFQPTFGYLLGFIAGAWLTGRIAWSKPEPDTKWLLLSALAGLVIVYAFGTVYCYFISRFVLGNALAVWPLLVTCVFLPLPSDLVLCVVSAILGKRLIPALRHYQQ